MNDEQSKTDHAVHELMTKAARQFGFKGKLEITVLRPKTYEEISKSRRDRQSRLRRRKITEIV